MTEMLIDDIDDVWELTIEKIKEYITKFGEFDPVIGGSPCNNLARCNCYHRNGLEGDHLFVFYHYVQILQ
ncbi:hypothetical protein PR202_gb22829 [Eleusine coracana subsp. coracana]|uniref:SAM-dependent MTase DRM-type domain-containing protein n=1 Tax=Eleusine coracana subsp. coracana TaxID=191504 RepID=A0AAV5FIR7_ELECO|nr:hypothetical protein PR202_gb22829 [Eleusine coracana subsp. coracana]